MLHNFFTKMSVKRKKKITFLEASYSLTQRKNGFMELGVKHMVCIFLSLDDPLIRIEAGTEKNDTLL